MLPFRLRFAFAIAIATLFSVHSLAQSTTARIVGTVQDSTGAVVPGVELVATNVDTGESRTATSGAGGAFSIPNLVIGRYEVSAQITGFKRYVRGPITLETNQTARVDVTLETGEVTESVTVTSEAPLLQTDDSSLGTVIDNSTIVELPLNGRNFIRLGSLMAGATPGSPGASVVRDRQEGVALSANGQRESQNNYILDGADNNETLFGVAVIVPSIDAIQEFKVQTGNYSAEFGRGAGAVVNVAIKSGTNQLRGTVYHFLRNDSLDAADFFTNYFGREKTPLRFNQFGFSAGGPVIKDRVFLFGNYEGLRERRTSTNTSILPTEALRNGDFTGQPTIFDPLNRTSSGARIPFTNNQIPSGRINPISTAVAAFWPAPNSTGSAQNFAQNFGNPSDRDQFHIRSDVNATDKDRFFGRVSWTDREDLGAGIAFNAESTNNKHKSAVAGWTHVLSPTMINDLRGSVTLYEFQLVPDGLGVDYASQLGLPSFASEEALRFPTITVRNFTGLGGNDAIPLFRKENTFQIVEQFNWIVGRHTVKAGADIRWYQTNNYQPQTASGNYNFDGSFTGPLGGQYANGMADFLLGLPRTQRILDPRSYDAARLRNTRSQFYVQDDFTVTPSLTLNLGIRLENDGAWREKNDRWAWFDFATGEVVYLPGGNLGFNLPYAHRFQDGVDIKAPQYSWAPRIGFAWRPGNSKKLVIRSAYGLFWGQPNSVVMLNNALTFPPYLLRTELISGTATPELQFGQFPGLSGENSIPRTPSFYTSDPEKFRNGYSQMWNFTVQRQFGSYSAQAAYVGNKGTALEQRYEANYATPGPGSLASRRRYPNFGNITFQDSTANSWYHSLQLQGEKRFSKGFQFLTAYTWSKALDTASSWTGLGGQDSAFAQDPTNLGLDKGRSGFDLRHRFSATYVYQLPFKFDNKAADLLLGGWQTSGILTLRTGSPFTVRQGGDVPNRGARANRPNLIGEGNLDPNERTIDRWFNTGAFVSATPNFFGTAGRNILDGPGAKSFDLSLMKFFNITERYRLQFRSEFFNVANHPNFGLPNSSFGNAALGTIRGGGAGREIQFALKLLF